MSDRTVPAPYMSPMRPEARDGIPLLLIVPAGLGLAFIGVVIAGLLWHIPWSGLWGYINNTTTIEALKVSLIVSSLAALICGIVGLPLAYLISRSGHLTSTTSQKIWRKEHWRRQRYQSRQYQGQQYQSQGWHRESWGFLKNGAASALRIAVLLPLVLPPVVGGTALLFALGRRGLVGQWLYDWFGISLPFTTAGAVLAATFVALPFFVISTETALSKCNPQLEEVAKTLGTQKLALFFRVIFPQILPGVLAGLVLSWARAIGEFGATITFAGNLEGRTQTLPLALDQALESGRFDMALAISFLLLAISVVVLILLRSYWFPALLISSQRSTSPPPLPKVHRQSPKRSVSNEFKSSASRDKAHPHLKNNQA